MEIDMGWVRVQEQEVVYETFTSAEVDSSDRVLLLWGLLQEADIQSLLSDKVCKLLDCGFGPAFDTFQELTLVSIVEIFDWLFEFNLGCPQRMNLHEFLQVEERLRHRQLVTAARWGQERFKFGPGRQLQYYLVDFSQRNRVYKLSILPIQVSLHEKCTDLFHIRVLELGLAVDSLDLNRHLFLECGDDLTAALLNQLFAFLHHIGRHNIIDVLGRNFDLHSLDAVATNDSNSVLLHLLLVDRVLNRVLKTD